MIFCTKCGTQLDDSAQFCSACGTRVAATASAPVQQAPAPIYQAPVQQAPVYQAPVYAVPNEAPAPKSEAAPNARAASIFAGMLFLTGLMLLFFNDVAMSRRISDWTLFELLFATPTAIAFLVGKRNAFLAVGTGLPLVGYICYIWAMESKNGITIEPSVLYVLALLSFLALGVLAVIPATSKVTKFIWYIPAVLFFINDLAMNELLGESLSDYFAVMFVASFCDFIAVLLAGLYIGKNAERK